MGLILLLGGIALGVYLVTRTLPDTHPLQLLRAAAAAKRFDVLLEFAFRLGLTMVTGRRKPFAPAPGYRDEADHEILKSAPAETAIRRSWSRPCPSPDRAEVIDGQAAEPLHNRISRR